MLCEIAKERKEKILKIVLTCWSQIFEFFHEFNFEGTVEACDIKGRPKHVGLMSQLRSPISVYTLTSIE